MIHPLKQLVKENKSGSRKGITSVCSANRFVLEAAMINAKKNDEYVLIEATANQVNQFGGYTGMTPKDFASFAAKTAAEHGLDTNRLLLGGDHLGPLTWAREDEPSAMNKAAELIRQYVFAGFTKIHIDTSMKLASDPPELALADEVIARRGAELCYAAEEAYKELRGKDESALAPVYVVGSEVPTPGGVQNEEKHLKVLKVTKASDFKKTVDAFKTYFEEEGLYEAWERVIAVVVQPGVEFGDESINEYEREKASELIEALKDYPSLVYEGHSTDYQTPKKLRQMVKDGIAILKVGPALTFALREALFALSDIEDEIKAIIPIKPSNFKVVLEDEMLKSTDNWIKYYHGDAGELSFKRKFSFSDRSRYYLPDRNIDRAISNMIKNLGTTDIPLALLSQYMPVQYTKVRAGKLKNDPVSLIHDWIINCLDEYAFACGKETYKV